MPHAMTTTQGAPGKSTFAVVQNIIAEVLIYEPEEINEQSSFDDTDLDILDTPEHERIVMMIQKKFPELQLDLHTLRDCETVADLVTYIEDERQLSEG